MDEKKEALTEKAVEALNQATSGSGYSVISVETLHTIIYRYAARYGAPRWSEDTINTSKTLEKSNVVSIFKK